jgi:hypothetical protein
MIFIAHGWHGNKCKIPTRLKFYRKNQDPHLNTIRSG